jgi:hypothetical protein
MGRTPLHLRLTPRYVGKLGHGALSMCKKAKAHNLPACVDTGQQLWQAAESTQMKGAFVSAPRIMKKETASTKHISTSIAHCHGSSCAYYHLQLHKEW